MKALMNGLTLEGTPAQIIAAIRHGWIAPVSREYYFCMISLAAGLPITTPLECIAALEKLGWLKVRKV